MTTRSNAKSASAEEDYNLNKIMKLIDRKFEDLSKKLVEIFSEQIKNELKDLKKSVQFCSDKIDEYEKRIKDLEKNQLKNNEIQELQAKVDANEQYARANNIEIVGIPEKSQENLMDVLKKIYTELKVEMPSHIEYASRVTPREKIEGRPRNVVVKLERRQQKDEIIAAIRKRKGITAEDINMHGNHNIFINEHLSPKNKLLHKQVREFSKVKKYKFCWIRNCKIYLRLNENSHHICINSYSDLEKIKKRDSPVNDIQQH